MKQKGNTKQFYILCLLAIGLLSVPFLTSPDLSSGFELFRVPPFRKSVLHYALLTIFLFANYYYFAPQLYLKKRWLWLGLSILVSYLVILFLPELFVQTNQSNPFAPEPPPNHSKKEMPIGVFSKDSYFFQFIVGFLLSLFLRIEDNLNKIKREQLESESKYLKAQIKPHFLFNTLNSIYALALNKSNKTPKAILKLSNLMRYAVNESAETTILLDREVAYIKDYVNLQQLRLNENTTVNAAYKGDFFNAQIAPLILINFIENAFKYGVSSEESSEILIRLELNNKNYLTLTVSNQIVHQPTNDFSSTKKGIENAKKRLEILYPNKHQLTIETEENTFKIKLELDLV